MHERFLIIAISQIPINLSIILTVQFKTIKQRRSSYLAKTKRNFFAMIRDQRGRGLILKEWRGGVLAQGSTIQEI